MANALGMYFFVFVFDKHSTVAYKRFVDNVPLAVDRDLVRGICQDVLKILNAGLGINGPNGHRICNELAQESPNVAGKREELVKKLETAESSASAATAQVS